MAVAGFSKDELSVEVKDRTLTVTGEHVSRGREFIHRGISTKKFKRTFRLSEHVHVNGADIQDGVLAIKLRYVIPEEMRPRKITIGHYEEKINDKGTKQLLTEDN
jgi:molecular chaperone IbpA